MLAKSQNALGYRVKSLTPKNGGSYNGSFYCIFSIFIVDMLTICSLCLHYILAKSENALGYRITNLTLKNGGSFMPVFTLYFHYLFSICSLYVPYMFTICWRNV